MMLTPEQEVYLAKLADDGIADEQAAAQRQAAIDAQETALGEAVLPVDASMGANNA